MKTKKYLLIIILIIAAFLRLWNLGGIPPSLAPDEASLGYNAYSILKTGRDEYGQLLPVIFKSFGDYKPGLYVYLAVPSVAIFGLTEFATRLPSAFAGTITVYLIYLLVQLLFTKYRRLATITAFVAATNPWLIFVSRGAWEVNVSLMFTLLGIYLFFKSLQKGWWLVASGSCFALTLLTYQGAKLSTGIVVILLAVLFWKDIFKIKITYLVLAFVLALTISSPILLSFIRGQTNRLAVFSIFSYHDPQEYPQGADDYLFHSEPLFYVRGILTRFFNHFSARFLFFEGDWSNPRHSAPNSGMLLLSDMLFLASGFWVLVRNKIDKATAFILMWLILAPLPAILSRDQVHAVRAMNTAIPLVVISAFGLSYLVTWIKKQKFSKAFSILLGTFYLLSFVYFFDSYFVHLPKHDSQFWEYGYKQVVQEVSKIQHSYKTIKVQQSFAQPYIYFLFYQKYDPAKYQKQAKLTESEYQDDVGYVTKLDSLEFVPIDWSANRGGRGMLFIADPVQISTEDSKDINLFKVIAEIKYLNGRDTAFRIVEVK